MSRYLVLVQFTEKGLANIQDSPNRAEHFRAAVARAGASIEGQWWTLGEHDGAFLLNAPDEAAASALVLGLGRAGFVRTIMLRAFQIDEWKAVLAKLA